MSMASPSRVTLWWMGWAAREAVMGRLRPVHPGVYIVGTLVAVATVLLVVGLLTWSVVTR